MSLTEDVTQAAINEFLAERRHAVLATNRRKGPPQLSPVWYLWDEGALYVSTSEQSIKAQNIRSDNRISVCVDGGWGDFRYVTLSGEVSLAAYGTELQQQMRWRIIRKYHDSDESARAYSNTTADDEPILIVLRPGKIVYEDFNR